jgi:hypothetical protein
MRGYGQFCPVAIASEIFAERWTPLVVRELFCGSRRFNELVIGLPRIPRSVLVQRLRSLETAGVNWGGTALIGSGGDLLGIGSLQLQEGREQGPPGDINMIVPIDLLKPVFDDLMTLGRPGTPPRPWLGLYATEIEDKVVIVGLAKDGPAQRADLRTGDVLLSIAGTSVRNLAGLYKRVWSLGAAGVEVPFSIYRDDKTLEARVKTGDRNRFLKAPRLH